MEVEYRSIGRLPTCIGNERIRVDSTGEVSHSRNTVECEPGFAWSAPWRPAGRIDAAAMARLSRQIAETGILESSRETVDESAQGGRREELDLALDGRDYHFVAQNADVLPFRAVVNLLWDVLFTLKP
jgi:hypothetical protein